jgi:DNA-binding IclR family transcriptional regulator
MPRPPRSTPAVVRAIAILQVIRRDGALSVPQIAAQLELPRSTTHELVHTLVSQGCLASAGDGNHQFNLGLALHELGSAYLVGVDLAREGQRVAEMISAACGETVHLASLDGVEVVYIVKADSIHAVRMVSAVGRRLPAHCTAVGKVLLSGISVAELARRFGPSKELLAMTAHSISSVPALVAELDQVRVKGLAIDNCESNPDVCCVGAPVFDHSGSMVAAMSVSVPTSRVDETWPGRLADLVSQGARELSRRLGFQGSA